jgi:hypothetical protein
MDLTDWIDRLAMAQSKDFNPALERAAQKFVDAVSSGPIGMALRTSVATGDNEVVIHTEGVGFNPAQLVTVALQGTRGELGREILSEAADI